jgi:hypothetical protein
MFIEIDLDNGHFALVDFEDDEHLAGYRWRSRTVRNSKEVQAVRYVTADGKRRLTYLHNEIMRPSEGSVVVFVNNIPSLKENRRVQHHVGCLKLKHQTPRALEHEGDCPDRWTAHEDLC